MPDLVRRQRSPCATEVAAPAALVALMLEEYVDQREWLADPFPALLRVAAGAVPIGLARNTLVAATSSLKHAVDGPCAREVDRALVSALTAETDHDVAVAASLAFRFLNARGDAARAHALAQSLITVGSAGGCLSEA
jgi:hypothetical protein